MTPLLQKSASPFSIFVGFPIWSHKKWIGQLYPKGAVARNYLQHYAEQIGTIELNSTFYQIPDPSQVARWQSSVPSGFKFCPKVFQEISRFAVLKEIPELLEKFIQAMLNFQRQLGPAFLQLPPTFGPESIFILKRFLKLLASRINLAVEFRHPAWFQNGQLIDPAFHLLAEHRISTVITDVAGRRDVLHATLSAGTVLIRFVGNSLHPSDFSRLQSWIDRLEEWKNLGIQQIYFFIHQPEQEGALELLNLFVDQANSRLGSHLKPWDPSYANPQQSFLGLA